jgi:hypothetical protein
MDSHNTEANLQPFPAPVPALFSERAYFTRADTSWAQ